MMYPRRRSCAHFSFLLAVAFALLLLGPAAAVANSPQSIQLSYEVQTLKAVITHSPSSPGHFVEKIEVRKNGRLVETREYKEQAGNTATYSIGIEAQPGDQLELKAFCNRFGSKVESLKVGEAVK